MRRPICRLSFVRRDIAPLWHHTTIWQDAHELPDKAPQPGQAELDSPAGQHFRDTLPYPYLPLLYP
jgi:hypothetical protein